MAKLPFVLHDCLRHGIPVGSNVPWYTVRFAQYQGPDRRAAIARAFEAAVFASPSLARDTEGEAPWRWSEATAIVPMPADDRELDWEAPGEMLRYMRQAEKALAKVHALAPIAEAWLSEEPSGGDVDASFEKERAAAREALLAAPAVAAPAAPPKDRGARAPAKPPAGAPALEPGYRWIEAPGEAPRSRSLPRAIAARFGQVYAAHRRGDARGDASDGVGGHAWVVLGYEGVRAVVAVFASADDAAPVESRVFHPSGIAESMSVSADGARALVTHFAEGVHEVDLATGATTLVFRSAEPMTDHRDAAYAAGGRIVVLTTRGLRLYDRARDAVVAKAKAPNGGIVVATAGGARGLVTATKGTPRARVFAIDGGALAEIAALDWVGAPYADGERLLCVGRGRTWVLEGAP